MKLIVRPHSGGMPPIVISVVFVFVIKSLLGLAFSPLIQSPQIQQRIRQLTSASTGGKLTSTHLSVAADVLASGEAAKVKKSREVNDLLFLCFVGIAAVDS
jgi:hypothetical protein